ncbi:MAG TPA: Zn-ribbon domain-containing OB-fold protein [Ramlibacter sp.]|uniref:Zn-ribbon domain-containing OB-fold protein n=1 Tax=Ramlibacter sp. TaxID=1917967 RepID=UPI002ECFC4FC
MTVPIETSAREIAAITRHPETGAFQEAAAGGRLVVPQCNACGSSHWYPRPFCPHCFADAVEWKEASGRGTVYSYTVMRRAKPVYVIAYVRLAEGATLMTNIVDCPPGDVRIGMEVEVVFHEAPGGVLVPMFRAAR